MLNLERIVKENFPELLVNIPSLPGTSDATQSELAEAIKYIRDLKLVQDAISILGSTPPVRSSITYPIFFPQRPRELEFRVEWVQGPDVFVGYIQSINSAGERIPQARLYSLWVQ